MMQVLHSNEYSTTQYFVGLLAILCGIYFSKIVHKYWIAHVKLIKAAKNFPGPPTIPLFGNTWAFADVENSFRTMVKIGEEYPFFRLWMGPKLLIGTTRPSDYEIVLTSSKTAEKAFFYKFMKPIMVDSLINGHGPKMRAHRKLLIPMINGKHLSNYLEVFNKKLHYDMEILKKHLDMEEFDIHDETVCCMADMIYETIFGIPGTSQDTGDLTLPETIESGLQAFYHRCISPWLYPSFLFNLSESGRTFKHALKISREYYNNLIMEKKNLYMALARNDPDVKKPNPSVLDLLIESNLNTNMMTDDEIRYNFIGLFIGSYDTILGIFSFAMLMLAMHHEVQEKVREEVMSVVGQDVDIVEDHIKKLTYIEMVIKETVRLFPIGPLLPREITEDIEINNYVLPKGSTLFMVPFITHRSKEYWDEPNEFIPERFLPENSKNRHSYAYLPFSAGPRICPGTKYSMVCLKAMIAHHIRNYQFTTTMKLESLKLRTHISVRSQNGYKMSIKKINL